MSIKTRRDGVVIRITPSADDGWSDVQAAVQRSLSQTGFSPARMVVLVDTTRAAATNTSEELRDVAAELARLSPAFAAVLIIAPDALRYGLARMLAAYADHLGTELLVFRSRDTAEAWLRAHTTAPAGG